MLPPHHNTSHRNWRVSVALRVVRKMNGNGWKFWPQSIRQRNFKASDKCKVLCGCFVIINIIVMMCDNFYCQFEILLVLFCYVCIVWCVRVCKCVYVKYVVFVSLQRKKKATNTRNINGVPKGVQATTTEAEAAKVKKSNKPGKRNKSEMIKSFLIGR